MGTDSTNGTDETNLTMLMMSPPREERRRRAEQANEAMDAALAAGVEPNAWLREQFKRDVVFGVWQDPTEPDGVAVALLKGHGRLLLISQGRRAQKLEVAGIRCTCVEEAEAMCRTFGDGRAKMKREPA